MIDSCAAGCGLRAVLLVFVLFWFYKKSGTFLFWVSSRGAVHYHLYEQGSGPWARALVHGIPLVSCKIFTIFFSSKLLIFYNFSRKDQFSSSSSSSIWYSSGLWWVRCTILFRGDSVVLSPAWHLLRGISCMVHPLISVEVNVCLETWS